MNLRNLKAAFVRLAYLACLRDPSGPEFEAAIAAIADDFSNLDGVLIGIIDGAESAADRAVLRALVAQSRAQVAALKGLLAAP